MTCTHYASSDRGQTLEPDKSAADGSAPKDENPDGDDVANDQQLHGAYVDNEYAFILPEEASEVLVVNSRTSGAYTALCNDACAAQLVAVDLEWRPDVERGSNNPIAVLQLAFPESLRVYVVQLSRLQRQLPPEVRMLLMNPMVQKVGFAVDINDMAKFHRSRIIISPLALLDMQEVCAASLGLPEKSMLGLKRAAEELLGYYGMDKDKRLSCSNWDNVDLTPEQVRYAAMDAWVTLRLYFNYQANSW